MPKMLSWAVDPSEGPVGFTGELGLAPMGRYETFAGWPYGVVLKKVHINEGSKV